MDTKRISFKIKDRIFDLIDLAFDLKEVGHDLFLSYSPHVNAVDIRLYRNGWFPGSEPSYKNTIYLDEQLNPEVFRDFLTVTKNLSEIIYGD